MKQCQTCGALERREPTKADQLRHFLKYHTKVLAMAQMLEREELIAPEQLDEIAARIGTRVVFVPVQEKPAHKRDVIAAANVLLREARMRMDWHAEYEELVVRIDAHLQECGK